MENPTHQIDPTMPSSDFSETVVESLQQIPDPAIAAEITLSMDAVQRLNEAQRLSEAQQKHNEVLETDGTELLSEESEDKKFVCSVCSHSFTRKHNLVSHELIHTQERPHTCTVCSSKFRRLHDLKRHEKLHTGEKPFECGKCGRKFARCDALVRHNNSQTGCALDPADESPQAFNNAAGLSEWKARDAKKGYETNLWKLASAQLLPSITKLAPAATSDYLHTAPAAGGPETRFRAGQDVTEREYEYLTYIRSLESRVAVLEGRMSAFEKNGSPVYS